MEGAGGEGGEEGGLVVKFRTSEPVGQDLLNRTPRTVDTSVRCQANSCADRAQSE